MPKAVEASSVHKQAKAVPKQHTCSWRQMCARSKAAAASAGVLHAQRCTLRRSDPVWLTRPDPSTLTCR
jgi:hypothetical protein